MTLSAQAPSMASDAGAPLSAAPVGVKSGALPRIRPHIRGGGARGPRSRAVLMEELSTQDTLAELLGNKLHALRPLFMAWDQDDGRVKSTVTTQPQLPPG